MGHVKLLAQPDQYDISQGERNGTDEDEPEKQAQIDQVAGRKARHHCQGAGIFRSDDNSSLALSQEGLQGECKRQGNRVEEEASERQRERQ